MICFLKNEFSIVSMPNSLLVIDVVSLSLADV